MIPPTGNPQMICFESRSLVRSLKTKPTLGLKSIDSTKKRLRGCWAYLENILIRFSPRAGDASPSLCPWTSVSSSSAPWVVG